MSNLEYQKILQDINNVWLTKYMHTVLNNINSVYDLAKDINLVKGVTNATLGDGAQVIYKDIDNQKNFFFEHDILIEINNIKIKGKIRLIPNEGGKGYHIVLDLSKAPLLNESNNYDKFSIKNFIKDLKTCNTFEDVKRTVKNYAVESTVILGTLLTLVLCNFQITDAQYYELGHIMDDNVVHSSQFYDYSEDPEWKLLCNDTEVTVYHAKKSQCNDDVQNTASMFMLNLNNPESHKIIAMERTMMKQYGLRYGDLIKIEGTGERDGVYQLQDTMNKRFKNKHKVDILINDGSQIGKWNNVKIFKLSNPDACYYDFKEDMEDALNQDSIDRRQNH